MTASEPSRLHLLLQAELDGELPAAEAAALAADAEARAVQAELRDLSRSLRAELPRYAAPPGLRTRLQARAESRPWWRGPWWREAAGFGLGAALAASVLLTVLPGNSGRGELDEVVASHIRALQPGHLTDVLSSDQHTVKPWFEGRTEFVPPVRDFAASGFPLVGARLDYLNGRNVAALVYRHNRHVIDLYVQPAGGTSASLTRMRDGYNVIAWTAEGMRFTAVSDLNAADLARFAELWQQPSR
jgi:anti-sigma factor RsiW